MDQETRPGHVSPPRRLTQQLALLDLVLDGMAKNRKDPDYPRELDALPIPARRARAARLLARADAARLALRKAAAQRHAEEPELLAFLEKVHAVLKQAYGKHHPMLFTYGFRPPKKPPGRPSRRRREHQAPGKNQ